MNEYPFQLVSCATIVATLDDATMGERLIKQVYETILKSPHWNSGLQLAIYDEHGGFSIMWHLLQQ